MYIVCVYVTHTHIYIYVYMNMHMYMYMKPTLYDVWDVFGVSENAAPSKQQC